MGGGLDDIAPLNDLRWQFTVLPADASQLRAIEAGRSGANLVIHGPPGTGKSQTIANIIATFLGEGRHVLFVSEKTAALDIVKRRLEDCGLGTFLLDLHSERGKKSSVYDQLRQSIAARQRRAPASHPFEVLLKQREALNRYVRVLHQKRDPLGRSVYEMNAAYAEVQDAPRAEFQVAEPRQLDTARLTDAAVAGDRIAARPDQFRAHSTSPWLPLKVEQASVQLADLIRANMEALRAAVDELQSEATQVAEWLGMMLPRTAEDVRSLARLAELLAESPSVPCHWLGGDVPARLRRIAGDQATLQVDYRARFAEVATWFDDGLPDLPCTDLAARLRIRLTEEATLRHLFGEGWSEQIVSDVTAMRRTAAEVTGRATRLHDAVGELAEATALPTPRTWASLDSLVETATALLNVNVVPLIWTDASQVDSVRLAIEKSHSAATRLRTAEDRMHEWFTDAVLGEVDDVMLRRFRVDYQSFLKRVFGGYRRDRQVLRGYMSSPRKLPRIEAVTALEAVEAVRLTRAEWDASSEERRDLAGGRYRGSDTKWDECLEVLAALSQIRARWAGEPPALLELVTSPDRMARLRAAVEGLSVAREALASALPKAGRDRLFQPATSLGEPASVATYVAEPLKVVDESSAELRSAWTRAPGDMRELLRLVDTGRRIREIEAEAQGAAGPLRTDFGDRFAGLGTDWEDVKTALDWSGRLLTLAGRKPSETLVDHATQPEDSETYRQRSRQSTAAADAFLAAAESAMSHFDAARTPWGAWSAAPLDALRRWTADLSATAHTANDWIEYRASVRTLDTAVGVPVGDEVRRVTDNAEQVPPLVRRRLIGAWLDAVAEEEPTLAEFSARDHEEIRAKFRTLDQAFPQAAQDRVRARCFEEYPDPTALGMRSGQLFALRSELSKKRRQLPVRKLFERIPRLLLALKPCVLVSPLAVSQYLPRGRLASQSIQFDAVIFDEASQVFPEDAVPALLRATQSIVVGDEKQLPPTAFFRRAFDDEDDSDNDGDEADGAFVGRESILDVLTGQVGGAVGQSSLDVHYRSRHDSLIRFSNHHFYDDRLLVFPQPDLQFRGLGIRDVYVPDGRYDAGASRTNQVEAERVVDQVMELMETHPDESVGVVALSRAQSDRITSLIEARRFDRPDLKPVFAEDRHERFFVKNLENVQGDERDHIVLSIGYGPTVGSNAVPNRFGPINRDGGQRRLNVAVTRARRSMTVVHSLRPTDIVSTTPGAQLLRRYLEYVQDPVRAFEREVILTQDAEPESPFEEAVRRALEARGHQVDSQIGVSGYRIDLGIRALDGATYDLGVECDGYTYHATPAARDRDWLRQEVLEGLGWCIHRVWSTSWVRNPEAEIARMEEALDRCRARADAPWVPADAAGPTASDPKSTRGEDETAQSELLFDERPSLFQRYEQADLNDLEVGPRLQTEVHGTLMNLVRRIVKAEGPVHLDVIVERIRARYGLGRAGRVIRERVARTVRRMEQEGAVSRLDDGASGDFFGPTRAAAIEPRSTDSGAARLIETIAAAELHAGLARVLEVSYGASRDELIAETARQFGYLRTSGRIAARLGAAVDHLIASGVATDSFGQITLREPPPAAKRVVSRS